MVEEMAVQTRDLWSLILDQPHVDPGELSEAIADQVERNDLDFRSRLLIRDSLNALQVYWGRERLMAWLGARPARDRIESIWHEDLGNPGFPFLKEQIMEPTRSEDIREFLHELSSRVSRPLRFAVGGSGALILKGYLSRRTQDLDVVDEVPEEIRSLGSFLRELEKRRRLRLSHFQSHYLPAGWEQRVHSLEPFGLMNIYTVDVHDVFLSKLFSKREKDLDDLRVLVSQLNKDTLARRMKETAGSFLSQDDLRKQAEHNWYVLYGEALPS